VLTFLNSAKSVTCGACHPASQSISGTV
jgi:hypothetical protein